MPRKKTGVKNKRVGRSLPVERISATGRFIATTSGAVDLHFHGAFGIDLMSAPRTELDRLRGRLAQGGVAAFCATTLSAPPEALHETVTRLGTWIRSCRPDPTLALPLGIHLEGPFVHPGACGAHPSSSIRALTLEELSRLWKASQGQLKILTVAPETLSPPLLKELASWCRARRVILSAGHSRATEAQAAQAFTEGFSGVTHAWNALAFHHREPGLLGAALGHPGIHLELIPDGVHVSATVIRWTLNLHGPGVCFVSDCVPAAATQDGQLHRFGDIQARFDGRACRLPDGGLAGGGRLLPESFSEWIMTESRATGKRPERLFRETIGCLTRAPLRALRLPPSTLSRLPRLTWRLTAKGLIAHSFNG